MTGYYNRIRPSIIGELFYYGMSIGVLIASMNILLVTSHYVDIVINALNILQILKLYWRELAINHAFFCYLNNSYSY